MSMRDTLVKQARKQGAESYVDAVGRLPRSLVGVRTRIKEILISPVKSLAMMSLPGADVRETGLAIMSWQVSDRQVMIVRRKQGSILGQEYQYERFSQREASYLVLARQTYGHGKLILEASGLQPVEVTAKTLAARHGELCNVLMSQKSREIVRCVQGVHSLTLWVRALISLHDPNFPVEEVEVVARRVNDVRWVDPMHACGLDARTDFSDGGMITVASQASLDLANAERAGLRPITSEALRMNIVFDATLPAYAEDFIDRVLIRPASQTSLALRFGGLCVRCSVPCVDPAKTNKPTDVEFLGWLAKNRPFRPDPDPNKKASGATLGVNCAPELKGGCSYINVGDEVEILSEK